MLMEEFRVIEHVMQLSIIAIMYKIPIGVCDENRILC